MWTRTRHALITANALWRQKPRRASDVCAIGNASRLRRRSRRREITRESSSMNIAPPSRCPEGSRLHRSRGSVSVHRSDTFRLLVARQFLAFTEAHWGKRTTSSGTTSNQAPRSDRMFSKSGTVYHLSPRLYRQIDRENIRNAAEHEIEHIQRRIAMLDFVLLNQGYQYSKPSPKKSVFLQSIKGSESVPTSKIYHGQRTYSPTGRATSSISSNVRCE